jgi:hypothetical protein
MRSKQVSRCSDARCYCVNNAALSALNSLGYHNEIALRAVVQSDQGRLDDTPSAQFTLDHSRLLENISEFLTFAHLMMT